MGPLDIATYQIYKLKIYVGLMFSEKVFKVFPIISLWELYVAMATSLNQISPKSLCSFPLPDNVIKIDRLTIEIYYFESVDGRRWMPDHCHTNTSLDFCLILFFTSTQQSFSYAGRFFLGLTSTKLG